jgi:hypothetical protein
MKNTKENLIIFEENVSNVINEIQDAFVDIPFGNSAFQTEMFVIAAQITPERMYRQIGLSLINKLQEIQIAYLDLEKTNIQNEKLKEEIESGKLNIYDLKLKEIELKQNQIGEFMFKKNINDMINEANIFYDHFKKFPRYTKEQFENGEKLFYEQKLARQIANLSGAKESVINMIDDVKTLENFQNELKKLSANDLDNTLTKLSEFCLSGKLELFVDEKR